ncbi:hypothetical protein [Polyangium mundeleinium]|uniref:Uncharacterized protein n=1 Tax=Polyangium mundeleinium TaxID=2995306 RepID=A0ABT5F1G6_9BACT|nr:hypothetical protein [Polyangium mundeleinium]MDC0747474.1 hypothetical protein [Polyangium mundeleinium]
MKSTFPYFDPAQCDYGPATRGLLRIIETWESIDWFEPPRRDSYVQHAAKLLHEHHRLAETYMRGRRAETCDVQVSVGGGSVFSTLYERARKCPNSWDWKYGSLKLLSLRHKEVMGWNRGDHARTISWNGDEPRPRTGHIIVKYGRGDCWNLHAEADLRAALPPELVEPASWYFHYAQVDLNDCIEWQLAEPHGKLEANPFFPLLQCYAAGGHPFSMSPHLYVLHAFARAA